MNFGFATPFDEQLTFFRQKLNLPTERWDDIKKSAHDRAFIVAGAMKADLLADLNAAVNRAIEGGGGQESFNASFAAIVQKHGWHGWTGEGNAGGEAWRMRVIFQTNLLTSRAAGRYRQLTDPELLSVRPFWRYVHADSVMHPRPLHQHWGNIRLTLRHDHPFWATHFPPNGWGCHCTVTAVRGPAEGDATDPPEGWDERDDRGSLPGIDKGFDYAPGANTARSLKDLIDQKLISLDAPIGAAMWQALRPALEREMATAVADLVSTAVLNRKSEGLAALAHVASPRTVSDLAERGVAMESADIWLRDAELLHALRDTKTERGASIPVEVWKALPTYLSGATPYLDTHATLVYAFDVPDGIGKVVVRVNYSEKARVEGKRTRFTSNFVRTGGVVTPKNLSDGTQYVKLEK